MISSFVARPLAMAVLAAAACASLPGCIPLLAGGAAAGTAVVMTDRRSSGTQLDDQSLGLKIESRMNQRFGDTARVATTVYDSRVLLTGSVPTAAAKEQANAIVREFSAVRTTYNQLTVGPILSLSDRSQDTWLTSKVRSVLLKTKYVPSGSISVTTDHSIVYLMGKVTELEGRYAATATAGVSGVARVVKLFDIITREQAIALSGAEAGADSSKSEPGAEQSPAPIQSGSGDSTGGSGAVQAIPIK